MVKHSTALGSLLLIGAALVSAGCDPKSYSYYLIDPEVEVSPEAVVDQEQKPLQPTGVDDNKRIKTQWNDGETFAEVSIPVISSGQRVIIEHKKKRSSLTDQGPEVVVAAPSKFDSGHIALRQAYLGKGYKENTEAQDVSLSAANQQLSQYVQGGSYALALAVADKVLRRYPQQVLFLRAKGSTLLLLGEKDEAIKIYEEAQDLEYSHSVDRKLKELAH